MLKTPDETKSVIILSFTPITDEPRVLRQIKALKKDGWNIVLCGYPGRAKKVDDVTVITFLNGRNPIPGQDKAVDNKHIIGKENSSIPINTQHQSKTKFSKRSVVDTIKPFIPAYLRKWIYRTKHIVPALCARFSDKAALRYYWKSYNYTQAYNYLLSELEEIESLKQGKVLVVAHDYFTMPIADKLSQHFKCRFVTDIHEYAKGQYMDSFIWRVMLRPWVDRMQKIYLFKSAYNTIVCDGIADLLVQDYPGLKRPDVIRSTPSYIEMPYRETGEKINVLYHGIVFPVRGMELAIESLQYWRPEFHLTIRGPGDDEYFKTLRKYAQDLGVSDRLTLEPPVLFDQIIPEANKADIGYFVHKDISPQKRFALPNKFFEYISAGLALCVSDLPEMAKITKQYDLGKLVSGYNAHEVAELINSMTRDDINKYKKNSLQAAADLCWENESPQLVENYNKIVSAEPSQIIGKQYEHRISDLRSAS